MRPFRLKPLLGSLLAALGLALLAVSPAAADISTGSVELDQPAYTAHEDQGELTITIVRSGDVSQPEHVGYGVKQQDAQNGIDFDAIPNTYITIPAGQSTYSFQVHIIDQGIDSTPVQALAYLYGAWPQPLGANNNSMITILHDDPLQTRDPANPLGAPIPTGVTATSDPAPFNDNPLAGVRLYVDPDSPSAQAARFYAHRRPAWSAMLERIASEPSAHRFYMWNMTGNIAGQVAHYLEGTQVQEPGTTVMLTSYNLVHHHCGYTATPAMEARYENYMDQLAAGIGNFHVIYFLELDSLITAPCLNRAQLAIRDAELRYAIAKLEALPHTVVYLDGGAADAAGATRQARFLAGAGVTTAQGFFLNSTHFDWTSKELYYGQTISRMLGGNVHFVINTGENGRGPLRPKNIVKQGNEVLCNPPGRGLGPLSVAGGVAQQTGYANADGFLWFSNPGGSGGQCVPGAPPTAHFWPKYAVGLARRWVNHVTGPRYPLEHAPLS